MRTSGAGTAQLRTRPQVSALWCARPSVCSARSRAHLPHDGSPESPTPSSRARAAGAARVRPSEPALLPQFHAWGHRSRALRTVPRELGLGAVASRPVKKGHEWTRTREMTRGGRCRRWRG